MLQSDSNSVVEVPIMDEIYLGGVRKDERLRDMGDKGRKDLIANLAERAAPKISNRAGTTVTGEAPRQELPTGPELPPRLGPK